VCVQYLKVDSNKSLEDWNQTHGELTTNLHVHEPIAQPSNIGTPDLEDAHH